ncbi:helix-turn-helix domain-containing protein [Mesobacillus subterraneus]|uniref:helix-turn-helix domain-containing protein n=1 Tax=Mesobacillus subterraneus TaxID=285983 RepID=UPI001CFCDB35|nr:helix-turn-helix domain-containing protein [Mesobacillus subterraneus]
MKETKADLILHPVRMKVLHTLSSGRRKTVQQIAEKLPEVPQATLYRHLKKLLDGKIIEVVEENQVRGTVEKVYALPKNNEVVSRDEVLKAGPDEHLDYFIKFMANVLMDFESYIRQHNYDFQKDMASFRTATLYASDEEYSEFIRKYVELITPLLHNEETPDRKKRTVTNILTTHHNIEEGNKDDERPDG